MSKPVSEKSNPGLESSARRNNHADWTRFFWFGLPSTAIDGADTPALRLMPPSPDYRPAPRFLELGPGFADEVVPAVFPEHVLRFRNQRWAERVGLASLSDAEWLAHFARFEPLPQNLERPLALRYHGHQFNSYNPELGDGRGFLFAQLEDERGRLLDLGTKGSGKTPYSRSADGRLTLKGGVREVLASEMLEALGVYSSKSFSLIETGESLFRGDEPSPTRSSVLVRLSHSHVRIGTFQRFFYLGENQHSQQLLDYCIRHFYPELESEAERASAFLRAVTRRSARLCGQWLAAGFVHGVLNSDNMTVTGESFDYGPYRFLPHYDPSFVAAYFDSAGLYAFGNQPRAVFRNLERLAEALTELADESALGAALREFTSELSRARSEALLARLGVERMGDDADQRLVSLLLDFLAATRMPYDRLFFDWFGGAASSERALHG
ncbi:MAG TPA: YdiU family protein, partial [Polyangiaceae bacterium]|nr:YdiU family protein [Polyangiaceae bacterium]